MLEQADGTVSFFQAMAPILIASVLTVAFVYSFAKISEKELGARKREVLPICGLSHLSASIASDSFAARLFYNRRYGFERPRLLRTCASISVENKSLVAVRDIGAYSFLDSCRSYGTQPCLICGRSLIAPNAPS